MYSLDEIGLIPAVLSDIRHRGDVNPYVWTDCEDNKLPIFVSPMTCIVNSNNILTFDENKVEPILPVISAPLELRRQLPNGNDWKGWIAVTMQEFELLFNNCTTSSKDCYKVLIDTANGHMAELFQKVIDAKQKYGNNLKVMIGNLANPETYVECCKAGVDYVRVGIGGGSGCTTSVQTGIHTSMPWLLEGIKTIKHEISFYEQYTGYLGDHKWIRKNKGFRTKVIADGGINTIAKAIKCLALGADYVMMGKAFAQCEEVMFDRDAFIVDGAYQQHNHYYGQSSQQGQIDRFGTVKSNPEGTDYWIPVTTNLANFTTSFEAALRSAMSYCGAHNLEEFIGKVKYEVMSESEFNAFNK